MLEAMVNRADVTQLNMAKLDLSAAAHELERAVMIDVVRGFVDFFDADALAEANGQFDQPTTAGSAGRPRSRLVGRLLDLLRAELQGSSGGRALSRAGRAVEPARELL